MELLNKYPVSDLKVYAVWFSMYPGDRRAKWRSDLLSDPRVTHFWDQKKRIGRLLAQHPDIDFPRRTLWDSYVLFGPDAVWEEQPEPLEGWGMPLYHRRHNLMKEITPLVEIETRPEAAEGAAPTTGKAAEVPRAEANGRSFDLMVIGAGGAGFAAAIRGAELGKQVALVEAGVIGGVCVNIGCVPSKTLLRAAEVHHLGRDTPFSPAIEVDTSTNWSELIALKDQVVNDMRKARYEDVLTAYPEITLVRGRAKLLGENQVEVTPAEGAPSIYSPSKIILSTGAHSWAPPIDGLEQAGYLDSTAAFELDRLPDSVIVVGASAVGLEIGQLFSRFGVEVTILEIQDDILPEEDTELTGELADYLRGEGLTVETNVFITEVARNEDGYRVVGRQLGEDRVYSAETLLMATGRRPNTATLGLDQAGVELGASDEVLVDAQLQTNNPHVFAAGDVLGREMYVYTAAYGGKLAADNALDEAKRIFSSETLPRVTFTDPAVAAIGLTEAEAYDRGHEVKVSTIPLELISRSQANGDPRGLIKLVADKTTDQLLGAHVLAPEAGEIIQSATLAIKAGMSVADLQGTLFPYLTMVEGLKMAAIAFDKDPAMLSCCAG